MPLARLQRWRLRSNVRRYNGGVSTRSLRRRVVVRSTMNRPRGPAANSTSGENSLRWPRLIHRLGSSASPPANRFQLRPPDHVVPAMIRPSGRVATRASPAAGVDPSCRTVYRRSGAPNAALARRIPVWPGRPAFQANTDCPPGASVIVSARPTSAGSTRPARSWRHRRRRTRSTSGCRRGRPRSAPRRCRAAGSGPARCRPSPRARRGRRRLSPRAGAGSTRGAPTSPGR